MDREIPEVRRYEVAALCRRDTTTIGRWISGEVPIPDEAKRLLCERFNCSVEHLLGWDHQPLTGEAA